MHRVGVKKSIQFCFIQSFSATFRVMDVRPENAFSCSPVVGRNFLTPGHPRVRVRNVRKKLGPKNWCLCRFSSLTVSLVAQTLHGVHHLCRATLVALRCVAFFALRFRSVARESRYTSKVSDKRETYCPHGNYSTVPPNSDPHPHLPQIY